MSKKKLYLITNDLPFDIQLEKIKKILPLGIDYLQYRKKNPRWEKSIEEIKLLKKLCNSFNVPFIINDNLQATMFFASDGIHLGEGDLPIGYVKSISPASLIIGATAKSVKRAIEAESAGATHLGVGAFYTSSTKPDARPMNENLLREIRASTSIPIFAIGGLTPHNITDWIYDNVDGFAFSSVALSSNNPEEIIKAFKAI